MRTLLNNVISSFFIVMLVALTVFIADANAETKVQVGDQTVICQTPQQRMVMLDSVRKSLQQAYMSGAKDYHNYLIKQCKQSDNKSIELSDGVVINCK